MDKKSEEKIFLEYFDEEKLSSKECIRNYKNRKVIFKIRVENQSYYIKKYVPYRMREKAIAFGIQRDKAKHYKFISEKMKELGVKHVEPYYIKVRRYSFFKRASILVTKDGGKTGGMEEKLEASRAAGVRTLLIDRPKSAGGISLEDVKKQIKEWMEHER